MCVLISKRKVKSTTFRRSSQSIFKLTLFIKQLGNEPGYIGVGGQRRMIMNGQMKKYKENLSRTRGPIMPGQIPKVKLDMRGLVRYAKEKRRNAA